MSAWIEIYLPSLIYQNRFVALLVSAWIEIEVEDEIKVLLDGSHSL